MPLRRLSDYTGIFIWAITVVFILGGAYKQQQQQQTHNEEIVRKVKQHSREHYTQITMLDKEIVKVDKELAKLQLQATYQQVWQQDFMGTFKELVIEIKTSNEKAQETKNEVIRNSTHLKAIKEQLTNGKS